MKHLNSIGMLSVLLAFGTACGSNSMPTTPQAATPCAVAISPTRQSVPIGGGTFSAAVTASASPCNWTASADASWIGIASSSSSGSTTANLGYSVPSNADVVRQGAIIVRWADGSASIAVDQDGVTQCIYNLSPSAQSVPSAGGSFRFTVTRNTLNGCSWSADTSTPWISLSPKNGLSPATITFAVDRNSSSSDRTGAITVVWHGGSASFVVFQAKK